MNQSIKAVLPLGPREFPSLQQAAGMWRHTAPVLDETPSLTSAAAGRKLSDSVQKEPGTLSVTFSCGHERAALK